jgi:CDP-diglyceride synthetase
MAIVTFLHGFLQSPIMLFFLLLGLWGLFRAVQKNGVDGSYMGALVIGEGLLILQGILGIVLWIAGERPGRPVHILYGVFAVVALPGLFAYIKGDDSNRAQWYYGMLTFFLFGVSIRAASVAV